MQASVVSGTSRGDVGRYLVSTSLGESHGHQTTPTPLQVAHGRVVLGAAAVLLLGLTVANRDAIIARMNLGRHAIIQTDVSYLGGLSVDRAPVVAEYVRNHPVECDSALLTDLTHDLKALDEDESDISSSWSARQATATLVTVGNCN